MRDVVTLWGWGALACWLFVILSAFAGQWENATLKQFAAVGVFEFLAFLLTALWVVGHLVLAFSKPRDRRK